MVPVQILLFRHAEKPADPEDPNLSPEGVERAKRLADLLPTKYGQIDFIFAAAPSKHSNRPMLTVEPLAKRTEVRIYDGIADQDYPVLAERLTHLPKYQGTRIAVCWHHGHIPDLAGCFGVKNAPAPWENGVFDRVWVITQGTPNATLKDEPQKIMPGDSQS